MPNDIMTQGRMGRPGGRPGGFPGRPGGFPGPGRPVPPRFPRPRPPFFFPIIIGPGQGCFRYDRYGRCCDRSGWCCDRYGRCGWEWDDDFASVPTMAMADHDGWYGMPGYFDMLDDDDDIDYDDD